MEGGRERDEEKGGENKSERQKEGHEVCIHLRASNSFIKTPYSTECVQLLPFKCNNYSLLSFILWISQPKFGKLLQCCYY